MKKVFSILFVALLAMSAWADTTVTIDFTAQGYEAGQQVHELTVGDVTVTFDKGTNTNNPPAFYSGGNAVRLYPGNSMTVSAEQNIKSIDFTFGSGDPTNNILCDVGSYNKAGKQWTIGSSDPTTAVVFSVDGTSGHRRIQKLDVTIEDAEPVTELVSPVFSPDGGEFSGSLAVTVSCPTVNASIYVYKVIDGEVDYSTGDYYFQNGEFYVTETTTYAACSEKGGEYSDFVYATFTKVEQTVEAPVFTPASCSFQDRIEVTLACATPNAKIYYSLDNEVWSEYTDAIPVTTDLVIYAYAQVGDVMSEVVSATYIKLPETTVEVTFDATVDKGDGDEVRHHYTIVKEPVTMYVGDGTVYPDHYRIYSSDSSALNFTSTGAPIIKIEFNGMANNTASNLSLAEGNEGTWTTGGNDGVWEGNAQYVAFKVNKQCRFTTIIVTLASGPVHSRGDVNHDGIVSILDVVALIDHLLGVDNGACLICGDVNGDEDATILDVTAIIDILLGASDDSADNAD